MPKRRVGCRDCGFCEHAPGLEAGLCWMPYDGPKVVRLELNGFCGYETRPHQEPARQMWLARHGHTRPELVAVLGILRLASANIRQEAGKDGAPRPGYGDDVSLGRVA